MTVTKWERKSYSYVQTIKGPAKEIFPLLCPERETEWLDGWDYNMIYSRSGVAEEGCVFTTYGPGGIETTWIITVHDPEQFRVEFVRHTPQMLLVTLKIEVVEQNDLTSNVHITYTYTPLSEEGNSYLLNYTTEEFEQGMIWWEKSMNHFLKTGERLTK